MSTAHLPSDSEMTKTDRAVVRFARGVIRWRWLVVLLSIAAIGLSVASIAKNLQFKTDYRVFFGPNNPQVLAFDKIEAEYAKMDQITFIFAPENGNAVSKEMLESFRWFTAEAWQLPYVTRVDSLNNFQHTTARGFDLNVAPLVPEQGEITKAIAANARAVALAEPALRNSLISTDEMAKDGQYAAINARLTLPQDSLTATPEAVAAARDLEQRYHEKFPGSRIYMTGPTMLNTAFLESSRNDLATLTPLQYVVICLVLWLLLRSLASLFTTMVVIIASMLTALGISAALGITITSITATTPTIIMTLAVADSIHILVTLLVNMRRGVEKNIALVEAIRLNMSPIFLTSITTAIGFLSMNFSDSPPLRDLGNISAIGVMMAYFFSVALLPALIAIVPMRVKQREDRIAAFSTRYGHWLVDNWRPALIVSTIAAVGLIWMAQYNRYGDDDFIRYFDEDVRFNVDTSFARDHFSGFMGVFYDLDTGEDYGITDPDYLSKLDAFVQWWEAKPEVVSVGSIVPMMKRINKSMEGDDPVYYKLPEDRDIAVDNLFMYEMGLPFGLDTTTQINMAKSGSNIRVVFNDIASMRIRELADEGDAWLKENAPELLTGATGPPVMFAHIGKRSIQSMQSGTLLAIICISMLLILALRNLKLGALSLVPNLLPLVMTLGIWSFISGEIVFTNAVVSGMTLGIVVDYTIHFLSKYLRAKRQMGLSTEDAIRNAFTMVGAPILATSAILICGFLVLTTSHFIGNSSMAALTAIAITLALICDFVLLPALLLWLDNDKGTAPVTVTHSQSSQLEAS